MYVRRVGFTDLGFCLSSHRHSYIGLVHRSCFVSFLIHNKQYKLYNSFNEFLYTSDSVLSLSSHVPTFRNMFSSLPLNFSIHKQVQLEHSNLRLSFHIQTEWTSLNTTTPSSPPNWNQILQIFLPRLRHYGLFWVSTTYLWCQDHTLTHHIRKYLVF
jgi:hypothetical protein